MPVFRDKETWLIISVKGGGGAFFVVPPPPGLCPLFACPARGGGGLISREGRYLPLLFTNWGPKKTMLILFSLLPLAYCVSADPAELPCAGLRRITVVLYFAYARGREAQGQVIVHLVVAEKGRALDIPVSPRVDPKGSLCPPLRCVCYLV
jgi:hypothetical protein